MSIKKIVKQSFIFLLFTCLLQVDPRGAEPEHRISLSVEAETERSQNREQTSADVENGSVVTTLDTESEVCTLKIEVENGVDQNDFCLLEWCFISKRTAGQGDEKPVVFDLGRAEIILQKEATEKKTILSRPFVFTEKTVDRTWGGNVNGGNSRRTRQGDAYAGYIVLVKAGGKILDQKSNSSRYLTDEWLARCEAAAKPAVRKKKK